eukprot:COSAG06_NODE_5572_length_3394_cov_224.363584_1_plen_132_part_00
MFTHVVKRTTRSLQVFDQRPCYLPRQTLDNSRSGIQGQIMRLLLVFGPQTADGLRAMVLLLGDGYCSKMAYADRRHDDGAGEGEEAGGEEEEGTVTAVEYGALHSPSTRIYPIETSQCCSCTVVSPPPAVL